MAVSWKVVKRKLQMTRLRAALRELESVRSRGRKDRKI